MGRYHYDFFLAIFGRSKKIPGEKGLFQTLPKIEYEVGPKDAGMQALRFTRISQREGVHLPL